MYESWTLVRARALDTGVRKNDKRAAVMSRVFRSRYV